MRVDEIMSTPVYTISTRDTIARARNLMLKRKISRLAVTEGEKLVGMVTKADLTQRLLQAEPNWRRRPIDRIPVKLVMTEKPITIYPSATPKQAAELMIENNIRGLPVMENERLIGMLTALDLVKWFSNSKSEVKVRDLMSSTIVTVHRYHSVNHVIDQMNENGADRVIVVNGKGAPIGIITLSDLAFVDLNLERGIDKELKLTRKSSPAGIKEYRYVKKVMVIAEDIMSSPLFTIESRALAINAAKMIVEEDVDAITVKNEELLGMISKTDIVAAIAKGIV
ncbi:MAG: CBS domain-containing protein [Methanocellales archaeon]